MEASLQPNLKIIQDFEIHESTNVIGYLRGSDPLLKNEFVVYTAHLDHEGIGRPMEGDSIYNGAYDNASGTAIMLEIARVFSELPDPPKRSVLFIALTAEEMGLLGSEYYVNHPTVELNNMVASLNLDMFLMEKPLREIVVLGEDLSGLGNLARLACRKLNVEMAPDPLPEENIFMRSDHINFVKKGIPSLFMINNYRKSDPMDENSDANYRWLRTYYHTPLDNFQTDIYYEAGVTFGQINFLTGYLAAEQKEKIDWNFNFPDSD
jgi:Zn-dependent M28 family amino/carboxypeptidase